MPSRPFTRKVSALGGGAVVVALIAGAGCGGPFQGKPECREAYDACINHCADACEQGRRAGGRADLGAAIG